MSFGGHALDMIYRTKLNRDQLKLRRKRHQDSMKRHAGSWDSYKDSTITADDMDEIIRQKKEYSVHNDNRQLRTSLIFLGAIVALGIIAVILLKMWV